MNKLIITLALCTAGAMAALVAEAKPFDRPATTKSQPVKKSSVTPSKPQPSRSQSSNGDGSGGRAALAFGTAKLGYNFELAAKHTQGKPARVLGIAGKRLSKASPGVAAVVVAQDVRRRRYGSATDTAIGTAVGGVASTGCSAAAAAVGGLPVAVVTRPACIGAGIGIGYAASKGSKAIRGVAGGLIRKLPF